MRPLGLGPRLGVDTSPAPPPMATLDRNLRVMAMTLRLTQEEDETLGKLARSLRLSKNAAAAQAIETATPKSDHPEFVSATTRRLLTRYAGLLERLAQA